MATSSITGTGTVKLAESKLGRSRVAGVNGRDDDDGSRPDLRWLSLPRGDHQLRGMAVFSVPVEPAHEMLAARGTSVTHETIRQWGLKFGREFANRIRRRAPRRGDKWHLDGVSRTRF